MPERVRSEFFLGGLAGASAALFSNPLETAKSRLQVQNELKGKGTMHYRGVLHTLRVVGEREGVQGLQKGLSAAVTYNLVLNSLVFACYAELKSIAEAGDDTLFLSLGCATVSSAFAGALSSPLFLMKVRMQVNAGTEGVAVGHQHASTGLWRGLRTVFQQEGLRGLFRGASGQVYRMAVGNGVQLSTYDFSKHFFTTSAGVSPGPLLHVACGIVSSCCHVVVASPFDLMATRCYNQPVCLTTQRGMLYTGPLHCGLLTFQTEGIKGWYKGAGALLMRNGPHTVLKFMFLEQFRRATYADPPPD